MPETWQQFFDAHAPFYDQNPFTQHTVAEVDFFLSLFPLLAGSSILDLGCGTGRHSVELSKRGFRVTGVDISEGMLSVAKAKSSEAGVDVDWIQADATNPLDLHPPTPSSFSEKDSDNPKDCSREKEGVLNQAKSTQPLDFHPPTPSSFSEQNSRTSENTGREKEEGELFDAAISLCEGGFGLIGPTENAEAHDLAILKNICRALKPGAPFLLTALNGYQVIRQMKDEHVVEGRFDPATMISNYQDEWDLPEGPRVVKIRERLFIPPEMVRLLAEAGFRCDRIFGGTAGNWGQRPLILDEIEVMYVCRKA